MKQYAALFALSALAATAVADLSLPKENNFYDQLGRGIANIALAPVEILDSTYELSMTEGPTVGYSKGLVQGISRMVMDMGVGIAEVVTSPFAPVIDTKSFKQPAYDSEQADPYPPADLLENWY